MKHLLIALAMAVGASTLGMMPVEAEAKRLGSGKPAGMQRQAPAKQADASPGAQANSAAPATAGAAAAAGKRSWMGPLAGLAAGLGLAALFSHLGMGEGLANFVMIALMAVAAFFVIRFLMKRFAGGGQRASGPQLAGAGAGAGGGSSSAMPNAASPNNMARSALAEAPSSTSTSTSTSGQNLAATGIGGASAAAVAPSLPGGMDAADFTRIAKQVFIRLQAANDAADVDDLRRFTTPELFGSLRADLLERGNAKQQTDVVQLDAEVVDVAKDDGRDIVSVRFSGLIREAADAGAEPFNEVWHLVRPQSGGDWAIAGITPVQ